MQEAEKVQHEIVNHECALYLYHQRHLEENSQVYNNVVEIKNEEVKI
jgi:hypothetical protein